MPTQPSRAKTATPAAAEPLVVFDFDGVLMDGMPEYWWAARTTALQLAPQLVLPEQAPAAFVRLRPLIHQGWEMVLMAAELGRADLDLEGLLTHYDAALPVALARWGWDAAQLQQRLEQVRAAAIAAEPATWLARHRLYPGVKERLARLAGEGADWAVLTTKGAAFASRLLAAAGLQPWALYGHEQGSKSAVLRGLLAEQRPLWFVEDRRPTLETVRADPRLAAVRCCLVSWGYLGPQDAQNLPADIAWLTPERFAAPLAQWP
ncbi:HAD family hydrolase [Cyanobium sp. Aljojuca 7D2]|uniref:HAD family hydrolase n=1 Tax=Cyanobium sp. Aljojuca 7D2 TaxID=2823698 RepID=UPI0020CFE48B|nr:HAD family hydrolase [Cyanobium sp. Aljojuca 7D2]MCP9891119.1 HAD family hydrolase [Cyanobium sp. Aljojuca 7D2]